MSDDNRSVDANRDPLTGAPGARPVGTGIGALLGGTAAGAATGTVVGQNNDHSTPLRPAKRATSP